MFYIAALWRSPNEFPFSTNLLPNITKFDYNGKLPTAPKIKTTNNPNRRKSPVHRYRGICPCNKPLHGLPLVGDCGKKCAMLSLLLGRGCLFSSYYRQCVDKDVSQVIYTHAAHPFATDEKADSDTAVVLIKARSFSAMRMQDSFLNLDRDKLWSYMMEPTVAAFKSAGKNDHLL
eukprot:3734893-Rhodomonas_salina.1